METTLIYINEFFSFIEFDSWEFIISALMIIICPITWNLVARWEFNTKIFSKLAGDNRLAADIFAHILIEMGIFRNYMFSRIIRAQTQFPVDPSLEIFFLIIPYLLLITGLSLCFMAYYRLGIHGIYYADYFGILMKEKVTAFPYNILDNVLYVGSMLIFLGSALRYKSPAGLLLTVLACIMYKFASILENPSTELIYSEENIKFVNEMKSKRKKSIE